MLIYLTQRKLPPLIICQNWFGFELNLKWKSTLGKKAQRMWAIGYRFRDFCFHFGSGGGVNWFKSFSHMWPFVRQEKEITWKHVKRQFRTLYSKWKKKHSIRIWTREESKRHAFVSSWVIWTLWVFFSLHSKRTNDFFLARSLSSNERTYPIWLKMDLNFQVH